jgi:hypothetical protein
MEEYHFRLSKHVVNKYNVSILDLRILVYGNALTSGRLQTLHLHDLGSLTLL